MNPIRHKRSMEGMRTLSDKADLQGYLTTDDLVEVYPDVCQDSERIEALLLALRSRGVDVVYRDTVVEEPEDDAILEDEPDPFMSLETISSDDTIGLYLKEMSRVPLLKMEEEISLAKRIESGRKARCLLDDTHGHLAARRREELQLQVEDGQLAREHLIKANTRLVVSIAKRYIGRGVPFLDLIQEGNLGLMKAVEKYEYQRGFRFSTYATWWIRQTISRAIADQGRTIRVPVHMVDRIRLLYRQTHELEQTLGRVPTSEELGEVLGVTSEKVEWMQRVSWLPLSLESPINETEEDSELGLFVEDQSAPTPIESAYSILLREKIEEVLETLSPRESRILRPRVGL